MTNDKKKVKDVDECLDELAELEEKYMGNCGKKKFDTKNKPYTKIIDSIKDTIALWDEGMRKRVLYVIHEKQISEREFSGIDNQLRGLGSDVAALTVGMLGVVVAVIDKKDLSSLLNSMIAMVIILTSVTLLGNIILLIDVRITSPKRSRKLAFYQLVDEILTDNLKDENK